MTNKNGSLHSISEAKVFHLSLVTLILFTGFHSATASEPHIDCKDSTSNQLECGIKLPEDNNKSINKTKWSIEHGNITEETNEYVKIGNKTERTNLDAETTIENQTYNFSRQIRDKKLRKPGKIGEKQDKEENINLGDFTDKKNESNIKNKTNEKIRKPPKESFNSISVNVKCPEKVNTSETFYCSVDIAKNTSSELETEWFSNELDPKNQEELKAEFETGEKSQTALIGYKISTSTTKITSTQKVVIKNPRDIRPPVQNPEKEEKIKELNNAIEEKNRTIEKLRNKVKQLKEELNNTKSNTTIGKPRNQSEDNQEVRENESENSPQLPEPKNNTEKNPRNNRDNPSNQSKDRGDEGTQSRNTLMDMISSVLM
ncbi:hypothetical protein [Candidatus Nanohalobium constans]|uniref:hypothetical protein n=1 Tax=Candidatus Nanohalobium constans TaxID=2565781 RepID=UPI00129837E2|nr:hypothetical protein [Candidatus Nanohalobium constans]